MKMKSIRATFLVHLNLFALSLREKVWIPGGHAECNCTSLCQCGSHRSRWWRKSATHTKSHLHTPDFTQNNTQSDISVCLMNACFNGSNRCYIFSLITKSTEYRWNFCWYLWIRLHNVFGSDGPRCFEDMSDFFQGWKRYERFSISSS